ncbi:amidohydrolase family protein [Pseudoflavonifractor sp. 60]|uniref:metal-dependent hydrolase family protein n=1 Tax=Pseudoflavonifractor sp. 60 TaxID=2304576 RepID=UPI0013703FC0|nr:amidohydrolase family protein [Pseudoflavonifractor sp. 60]NBI67912.1 amidohydrolase family protein [Pseudoflavonifractor sp. 60]
MFLIKNCRFVSELTEGTELTQGDILLDGNRIKAILPAGSQVQGVTEELDANGMTILPGLIDAHVHLTGTTKMQTLHCFHSSCRRSFDALEFAQFLLDHGYTTVRDCGDNLDYATIALRDAICRGVVKGPNVIPCGLTLCVDNFSAEWKDRVELVSGPGEFRKAARNELSHGAEFIKLYGSGSIIAGTAEPGAATMMDDEIQAAVEIATFRGTYCAIHSHGRHAIDQAVRLGVRTIEHATFIGEETLRRMDGRKDCGIIPTLAVICGHISPKQKAEMGSARVAKMEKIVQEMCKCLRNAYENHDVLIGWGTDVHLPDYRHDPYAEFRMRHDKLGCSNIELLKQATINSAKLICKDDQIGSIKEGKLADLILVQGNPESDIQVMYEKPIHVIKSGSLIR